MFEMTTGELIGAAILFLIVSIVTYTRPNASGSSYIIPRWGMFFGVFTGILSIGLLFFLENNFSQQASNILLPLSNIAFLLLCTVIIIFLLAGRDRQTITLTTGFILLGYLISFFLMRPFFLDTSSLALATMPMLITMLLPAMLFLVRTTKNFTTTNHFFTEHKKTFFIIVTTTILLLYLHNIFFSNQEIISGLLLLDAQELTRATFYSLNIIGFVSIMFSISLYLQLRARNDDS